MGFFSSIIDWWAQSEAAHESRMWQEEMWHKQNEYDSPVNQRARLEEAGINPNLAFGSAASATYETHERLQTEPTSL